MIAAAALLIVWVVGVVLGALVLYAGRAELEGRLEPHPALKGETTFTKAVSIVLTLLLWPVWGAFVVVALPLAVVIGKFQDWSRER